MRSKSVTLADVARRAGVSMKTASRVINNEPYVGKATRQRVLDVVAELDYHPNLVARRLAAKQTQVIGLLVPSIAYPIFPQMILGVEQVMYAHNYDVLTYNTEVEPARSRNGLQLLAENQVDGVIVGTVKGISNEELRQLLDKHRASVLINMVLPDSQAGVVRLDVVHGVDLIVQHLVARGRQKIAFLTYPVIQYSATERLHGFRLSMAKYNAPLDESLIVTCADDPKAAYAAARTLLQERPDVDAIVCYNDLVAAHVMKACFEMDISIPDQVAITGFDDILFTDLWKCSLTTVHSPGFEMGVEAASMLLNHIEGKRDVIEIVITPELIVRESAP